MRAPAVPIAIVGMALRFPGADSPAAFWRLLCEGRDAIRPLPADRRRGFEGLLGPLSAAQQSAVQWGGFLDGLDQFDAAFFGISAAEARSLDPKQRLALELAWESLEDAGIAPDTLRGSPTGVFMGTSVYDYFERLVAHPRHVDAYLGTGNFNCVVPNRVSYFLDLRGPSLAVETACSASLTAVQLACASLAEGSASLALAGGAMVLLSAAVTASFAQGGFLAPDGRCKAFDDRADGYVRGEGAGIVVLKRLSDAVASGDRIYAVVAGGALNQDGRSNGLTAPNPAAQAALLRDAYAAAGMDPHEVDYVEAHGTGTRLGDPMEVKTLGAVCGLGRAPGRPLRIGSVKTNIGHLEAAAGVAGLIKAALALHHGQLPPSLHFERPNALIPFEALRVAVQDRLEPWPSAPGQRRVAGVSSFSFAGANAHLVLTSAPAAAPVAPAREAELFCLSTKTAAALEAQCARLAEAFDALDDRLLTEAAATLQQGRSPLRHRAVVVASSFAEAARSLRAGDGGSRGEAAQGGPRVAFAFPGQGSQSAGMGRDLHRALPAFGRHFDACAQELAPYLDVALHALCWGEAASLLARTRYTQPALFAVEYATARTLIDLGIRPAAFIGHSVGEYAAAVLAEVMTLAEAARLVARRGALIDALPAGGQMRAVLAGADIVTPLVEASGGALVLSAINGPRAVTVSGPAEAMTELVRRLEAEGVVSRPLDVSHAFHSPAMAPAADAFRREASDVAWRAPRLPVYSTVTGRAAGEDIAGVEYWAGQIVQPVRFAEACASLWAARAVDVVIEVGPGTALAGLMRRIEAAGAPSILTARPGREGWAAFLDRLGQLYVRGTSIDWSVLQPRTTRAAVALPGYPFQRSRHWLDEAAVPSEERVAPEASPAQGLLGPALDVCQGGALHDATLSVERWPLLDGHRVFDRVVLPGTATLCMAWEAARRHAGAAQVLHDIRWDAPLALVPAAVVQTLLEVDGDHATLRVCRRDDVAAQARPRWTRVMSARTDGDVSAIRGEAGGKNGHAREADVAPADLYARLNALGLAYGPAFRGVTAASADGDRCDVRVRSGAAIEAPDLRAAVMFDACLQGCALLAADGPWVPWTLERFEWTGDLPVEMQGSWRRRAGEAEDVLCVDGTVTDGAGRGIARLAGLRLRRATRGRFAVVPTSTPVAADWTRSSPVLAPDSLFVVEWIPRARFGSTLAGPESLEVNVPAVDADVERYRADLDRVEAAAQSALPRALCAFVPALADPSYALTDEAQSALEARLPAPRRRLLARLVRDARSAGLLWRGERGWRLSDEALRHSGEDDGGAVPSSAPAERHLLERCLRALPAVAAGTRDAVEVLFEGEGAALLARVYGESAGAKRCNRIAADAVAARQSRLEKTQGLRVLEVGAGTGATTAEILARVDASRCDYTFTDVSTALLARARERFVDASGITFRTFDLERPAEAQGLAVGGHDVIVAANVVHATTDLRRSLDRLCSLLAPGGTLVLVETVQPQLWLDLTFGLTAGWWGYTDDRRESPLLGVDGWRGALRGAGFANIRSYGEDAKLPQRVLVAHKAAAAAPGECWWMVGPRRDELEALAAAFAERGAPARIVVTEGAEAELDLSHRASSTTGFARLVESAAIRPRGVLYVPAARGAEAGAALAQEASDETTAALNLVQAVAARSEPLRLALVTRGAQPVVSCEPVVGSAQAPILGLLRSVAEERPELQPRAIDVDRAVDGEVAAFVAAELLSSSEREPEIAWRSGHRWVPRLHRQLPIAARAADASPRRLRKAGGRLDGLALAPDATRRLGADEVLIDVSWSGVNYLDVLDAIDALPFERSEGLGAECVGRVVEVGQGVTHVQPGQWVMALAPGAMADRVIADARLVVPVPEGLAWSSATGLPVAFATAHAALACARVQTGDVVLVHAAAGATGLAVLALARARGVRILATASAGKEAFVSGRGAERVFDSRRPTFASGVRAATGGRGADAVINSLTSPGFVEASVESLARGGRFVELAKRDIWSPAAMAAARPDVAYHVVDLYADVRRAPAALGATLREVTASLCASVPPEPLPLRLFAAEDAVSAFQLMRSGRHVGKLALAWKATDLGERLALSEPGCVLITGGLGGLGLLLARRLTALGARHLVLAARQAEESRAAAVLRDLRAAGATVELVAVDVGDAAAIQALGATFGRERPPLRSVFHAAGTLADATLDNQDRDTLERTFRAKVRGTALLAQAVRDQPLRAFVLCSSIASLFGSSGQANHAAANAFLDTYAARLRNEGLPALALNLGAVAEVGAAAALGADVRASRKGLSALSPAQAVAAIEAGLQSAATRLVAVPLRLDACPPELRDRPLLADLVLASPTARVDAPGALPLAALSASERERALERLVQGELAKVLGFALHQLDLDQGFTDLGIDSLGAVEMRNRLQQSLGLSLPSSTLFDYPNVRALCGYLLGRVAPDAERTTEPPLLHTVRDLDPSEDDDDESTDALMRRLTEKIADLEGSRL